MMTMRDDDDDDCEQCRRRRRRRRRRVGVRRAPSLASSSLTPPAALTHSPTRHTDNVRAARAQRRRGLPRTSQRDEVRHTQI